MSRRLNVRVGKVAVLGTCNAASTKTKNSCDVAVGLGVAVTAASRAIGLGNIGASALAGDESTAALLAVRVLSAGTGDELVATASERVARWEFVSLDAHENCQ